MAVGTLSAINAPAPPRDAPPRARLPYLPGLDGVRAIAVAAVLLFHLPARLVPGGFLGVDVFFVLSGFLITTLLLEELDATGRIRFRRFYLGRGRRLLPALVAVLAVSSVLVLTVARDAAVQFRQDVLAAATYVTNWWYVVDQRSYFEAIGRPPMLQHLWSLAVEEQFYLVWPAVALVAWRVWGRRGVGWVALGAAVSATVWMGYLAVVGNIPAGADTARLYFGSDTHAMTVLLGAALAVVWRPDTMSRHLARPGQWLVTSVGSASLVVLAVILMATTESAAWLYRGGFLLVALAVVPLVMAASHPAARFGAILGNAPMRWLGTRSYGIYLWHWPIFLVTRPDLDLPYGGWAAAATSLTVTGLVAEASFRWIEMPVRRGALASAWRVGRGLGTFGRLRWAAAGVATVGVVLFGAGQVAAVPGAPVLSAFGGVTSVGAGALLDPGRLADAVSGSGTSGAPGTSRNPSQRPGEERVTAVGDSVLLGARSAVAAELPHVTFDAEIGRQPWDLIDRVRARERADALGDELVIQTGTNGIPPAADLRSLLTSLGGLDRIVVVNVQAPVEWMDQSNRALDSATRGLRNVVLVDWASLSAGHRDYFLSDGVHLTPRGAEVYAQSIVGALA